MAPNGSTSATKQKLTAARENTPGSARSALRALRLSLARAAEQLFGLALSVIGARQSRVSPENLGQALSDDHLLILLDGPGGHSGAITLDRACLAALIQQQTMGQVTGSAPPERDFTSTDAALAAPLVDAMLERAGALVNVPEDRRALAGFRYGARTEDLRTLVLALDADRYRIFDLTLEFCGGVQQGAICLALPDLPQSPAEKRDASVDSATAPRLEQALVAARADLTAVICRLQMPLSELTHMAPGDIVPLTGHHLSKTDLISICGDSVATGRLGQVGGARAIRLNETEVAAAASVAAGPEPDARFLDHEMAKATARPEAVVVAGRVAGDAGDGPEKVALPAVIEDDGDAQFLALSPEQAAAEISELAGLSPPNAEAAPPIGNGQSAVAPR